MRNAGEFPILELSATLEPLASAAELKQGIGRLAGMGIHHVQLSATHRGLRPRELDAAARKDLLALLRRHEMNVSGVDLWIPPAHFIDAGHVDRAMDALESAITFAADLGRCPVSLTLPPRPNSAASEEQTNASTNRTIDYDEVMRAIAQHADHHGVSVADHSVPAQAHAHIAVGIDPPAWLGRSLDIAEAVLRNAHRLAAARLCDLLTTGLRAPIGDMNQGRLDACAYHAALAGSGFSRSVTIDARQWQNPWQGLQRTAAEWARCARA